MDAISDFALFRAIVDAGGISAAALVLQSSPAAVSRRLTALVSASRAFGSVRGLTAVDPATPALDALLG